MVTHNNISLLKSQLIDEILKKDHLLFHLILSIYIMFVDQIIQYRHKIRYLI